MGVSGAVTRSGGASSRCMPCVATRVITSAATPPQGKSSLTTNRRAVRATEASTVSVSSGLMVRKSTTSGYELEVVDLRTVKPLDTDTILASVARTARLMVVSEDFPWGGVAAEVIARVATEGMHLLDAPPLRVTAPDTPIPAHPDLWKAHRPGYENITAAARYLISL